MHRHARAVMHGGIAIPRWRENVPSVIGACATRDLTYLARGPLKNNREHCGGHGSDTPSLGYLTVHIPQMYNVYIFSPNLLLFTDKDGRMCWEYNGVTRAFMWSAATNNTSANWVV